jgi:hypothetical protein
MGPIFSVMISSKPNCTTYCVIFIVCTYFTHVDVEHIIESDGLRTDCKPQVGNPHSKHNYVKKELEVVLCVDRPMTALMDEV